MSSKPCGIIEVQVFPTKGRTLGEIIRDLRARLEIDSFPVALKVGEVAAVRLDNAQYTSPDGSRKKGVLMCAAQNGVAYMFSASADLDDETVASEFSLLVAGVHFIPIADVLDPTALGAPVPVLRRFSMSIPEAMRPDPGEMQPWTSARMSIMDHQTGKRKLTMAAAIVPAKSTASLPILVESAAAKLPKSTDAIHPVKIEPLSIGEESIGTDWIPCDAGQLKILARTVYFRIDADHAVELSFICGNDDKERERSASLVDAMLKSISVRHGS
jgi:hypothetical protein